VPRSFWPAAGIKNSGFVQHRKSAIHGLPVKSGKSDWLRIWNEYSAHAQKIGSVQSSRSLPQVRRIVALGTRMVWLQSTTRSTTVNPSVFDLKIPKRCVAAGCSNERNVEEGWYFPLQTAILRRRSARNQGKEKEMGGFCWAEASEFGTILVFSAVLLAFQKERFRSFSRFGRWKKSPHFKEMAKDLCHSFTTVNRLVLRGSERKIEFQATHKRIHKSEDRGEKSHAVLLSTSQLYSPQVPDKRGLEPNISRL